MFISESYGTMQFDVVLVVVAAFTVMRLPFLFVFSWLVSRQKKFYWKTLLDGKKKNKKEHDLIHIEVGHEHSTGSLMCLKSDSCNFRPMSTITH